MFAPDKEHIHYQLQEIGHTHRRAVLIMYLWSVLLASSALAITFVDGRAVLAGVVGGSLVVIASTVLPQRIRKGRARRAAGGRFGAGRGRRAGEEIDWRGGVLIG